MKSNEKLLTENYIDKLILSTKNTIADLELSLNHLNSLKKIISKPNTPFYVTPVIKDANAKLERGNHETSVLISLKDLTKMTGLSRSTIYKLSADGDFPKKVHLGVRSVAWLRKDIEEWISDRINEH